MSVADQGLRLECLKLALTRGANDPRPVAVIADEFCQWCQTGRWTADEVPQELPANVTPLATQKKEDFKQD